MPSIAEHLLNILLPSCCLSCGDDMPAGPGFFGALCGFCHAKIEWRSSFEPLPGSSVEGFFALSDFGGPVRDLLHDFKYRGKERIGDHFADMWLRYTPLEKSDVEAIVPVPMSPWKEFNRGFNPATVIARRIAKAWQVPVWERGLSRRWISRSQTNLGRNDRKKNAERSFTLSSRGPLRGRSVLLVDDVCTTGATLGACASLLKKAGVRRVLAGVAARENS